MSQSYGVKRKSGDITNKRHRDEEVKRDPSLSLEPRDGKWIALPDVKNGYPKSEAAPPCSPSSLRHQPCPTRGEQYQLLMAAIDCIDESVSSGEVIDFNLYMHYPWKYVRIIQAQLHKTARERITAILGRGGLRVIKDYLQNQLAHLPNCDPRIKQLARAIPSCAKVSPFGRYDHCPYRTESNSTCACSLIPRVNGKLWSPHAHDPHTWAFNLRRLAMSTALESASPPHPYHHRHTTAAAAAPEYGSDRDVKNLSGHSEDSSTSRLEHRGQRCLAHSFRPRSAPSGGQQSAIVGVDDDSNVSNVCCWSEDTLAVAITVVRLYYTSCQKAREDFNEHGENHLITALREYLLHMEKHGELTVGALVTCEISGFPVDQYAPRDLKTLAPLRVHAMVKMEREWQTKLESAFPRFADRLPPPRMPVFRLADEALPRLDAILDVLYKRAYPLCSGDVVANNNNSASSVTSDGHSRRLHIADERKTEGANRDFVVDHRTVFLENSRIYHSLGFDPSGFAAAEQFAQLLKCGSDREDITRELASRGPVWLERIRTLVSNAIAAHKASGSDNENRARCPSSEMDTAPVQVVESSGGTLKSMVVAEKAFKKPLLSAFLPANLDIRGGDKRDDDDDDVLTVEGEVTKLLFTRKNPDGTTDRHVAPRIFQSVYRQLEQFGRYLFMEKTFQEILEACVGKKSRQYITVECLAKLVQDVPHLGDAMRIIVCDYLGLARGPSSADISHFLRFRIA